MEALGADAVIAHLGFDERVERPEASVSDFFAAVVPQTHLPAKAVGGIRIEDRVALPALHSPLVISADTFAPAPDEATRRQVLR